MDMTRHRLLSQRHFGWLLWLVLLLPVAQTAASWHVLSHAGARQTEDASQQALDQDLCDLCVSAAALLGGAPLRATAPWPANHSLAEAPRFNPSAAPVLAPVRTYDSRAPPLSLL
jgi:hypothetical protein